MSHPSTADSTGFRAFDGTQFGELQTTSWEFDGSVGDVEDFAESNLCSPTQSVVHVKQVSRTTFDVTVRECDDSEITDNPGRETEYRIYTAAE